MECRVVVGYLMSSRVVLGSWYGKFCKNWIKNVNVQARNYVRITVWYGTFICDLDVYYTMSQMLSKPKNYVLYSDLLFTRPQIHLRSSATEVSCQICKSELKEGVSITAKRMGDRTVFVCSEHGF